MENLEKKIKKAVTKLLAVRGNMAKIAKTTGIRASTLSQWKNPENLVVPNLINAVKIAQALDLSLDELVGSQKNNEQDMIEAIAKWCPFLDEEQKTEVSLTLLRLSMMPKKQFEVAINFISDLYGTTVREEYRDFVKSLLTAIPIKVQELSKNKASAETHKKEIKELLDKLEYIKVILSESEK